MPSSFFKDKGGFDYEKQREETIDRMKSEHARQKVEVNFYGPKPSMPTEVSLVGDDVEILSQKSRQLKKYQSQTTNRRKRYGDMSPSERENGRAELLKRFKDNVLSLSMRNSIGMDPGSFSKTLGASTDLNNLFSSTVGKTDAFSQRLQTTKNSGFGARKPIYQKPNEKLWNLLDSYKNMQAEERQDREIK